MCKLRCYLSMVRQQHLQGFNALFGCTSQVFLCFQGSEMMTLNWQKETHIYMDDIKASFAAQVWPCLSSSRRKIMIWMHKHPHTFVGGTCLRFLNAEANLAWHALPIFLELKHCFWIHRNHWTWTCSVLTYNMEWSEVTINSNPISCKSTFLLDPNLESQLLLSCKTSALVCSGPRNKNLHQKLIGIFQMLFVTRTDLFAWCWLPGFESHLLQPAQFQGILCIEVEHIVMPCPCPPPVAWNPYPLKQGQSLHILPLLYEHWRHDG